MASVLSHTLGASLQRRHPPVMAVVHRVWLIKPELDRSRTLLCFFGDDARPAAFRNEYPSVVKAELWSIDTPAELSILLNDIHRASNREAKSFPGKAHTH